MSPVKVWEKSRRIGASWADAAIAALDAAIVGGCDTYYVGYNREMAEQYIEDVAYWAKGYQIAAERLSDRVIEDEDQAILVYRVRFASGHKVAALSSRPSNLRAKKGKVVIDEAAFHDDLEALRKAAMAILAWGGQVRIISTHNGIANSFNKLCEAIRKGDEDFSLHTTPLDEAIADGLYARICLVNGWEYSEDLEQRWRDRLWKDYGRGALEELGCIPNCEQGGIVSSDWIQRYRVPPDSFTRIVQSWDTAQEKGKGSACWACTTWGELENKYYLLEAYTQKHNYPSGKAAVISLAGKWKPNAILIEKKSTGASLLQELPSEIGTSLIGIVPEGDKVTRLNVESTAYEAGRVYHPESASWLAEYEQVLLNFPSSAIADPVDSTSQFLRWARTNSLSFEFVSTGVRRAGSDSLW